MCGRYSFFSSDDIVENRWQAKFKLPIRRHFNAAPSQQLPVILNTDPESIVPGTWGLVPKWMKMKTRGIINARVETVREKPSFRTAVKKQRCLVLADSFFEWNRKATVKIPYRILLRSEQPFAFAGIWETYQTTAGLAVPTFSIITVPANELVLPLHDRMPVILEPKYEQLWIDSSAELEAAFSVLKPLPAEQMKMFQVSPAVNSYRNDSPDIIRSVQ
ncbi:MAG: SOS response-associated peptidase [Patescibacteria group bacterium]|nr:SOS response-associated peptidase [Patescibacteria group bacterium]